MNNEPLYDYPVSRSFRSYEALMNEGIYLPSIDPPEADAVPVLSDYLKKIEERLQYFSNLLEQERGKWRFLENKVNQMYDKSKRSKRNVI